MKTILGEKIGITKIFDKDKNALMVTVIKAGPCFISQVKKSEREKYNAIQLAFGEKKFITKPLEKHLKEIKSNKYIKEVRLAEEEKDKYKQGDKITVEIFKKGEKVDISGTSKGKGYAGTVKRHNFTTGPKTHGSDNYRQPGSIGAQQPQRVISGKRMSGHMGNEKITIKNIEIVDVINEDNIILVKGSVPGVNKSLLVIKGR